MSPFADLLAEEPLAEDVLVHDYRTPSLTGRARQVGGSGSRALLVDPGERIVARGTYRVCFEKSLLPDEPATQLLDDERRRLFAAWLARRPSRAVPLRRAR